MAKELIVANRPKSGVSEAIKTIRTNLQFSSVDEKVKKILVTSSFPGEGKSFISANLAVSFAQTGAKVLIIDCDMRKGRQHIIFEMPDETGLSNLLITDLKDYRKYIKETGVENLSVLSRGIVPPNPSELLASEKNKELIKVLEKEYDIIIFDGPPVGGLTDSVVMSNLTDKIVIVSAYKSTPIELLEKTTKSLSNFKDKIAGVILNKVPSSKNHYYNNYYTN